MFTPAATIRPARIGDALEITRLAGELGYPTALEEMERRLGTILTCPHHYLVVVSGEADPLLGWLHVEHRVSIEGGDRAELMGLVIDSKARRHGIGRALVTLAENWAWSRGLPTLTVRSNTACDLSHPFYEALGYVRSKTQHVYTKATSPSAATGL